MLAQQLHGVAPQDAGVVRLLLSQLQHQAADTWAMYLNTKEVVLWFSVSILRQRIAIAETDLKDHRSLVAEQLVEIE